MANMNRRELMAERQKALADGDIARFQALNVQLLKAPMSGETKCGDNGIGLADESTLRAYAMRGRK